MYQSSKTRKYLDNKPRDSEKDDRINSLPEELLAHILSLMPAKYAVRTSSLSTRWRSRWASVPSFDFVRYTSGDRRDEISGFMDFVDRVLLLHNLQNIERFHLNCECGYYNPYCVNSWIRVAIKLNVQELALDLNTKSLVELPRILFTSVNLVVLKLAGCVFFPDPMVVFLPSFKVLHLDSSLFLDDDSFKNLLSGCPVLEELNMTMSGKDNIMTLSVCPSTLKKFRINWKSFEQYAVVIEALVLEGLETIELNGFGGLEEMKFVRYLLANAMVLKKLTIIAWNRNKQMKTNLLKYICKMLEQMSNWIGLLEGLGEVALIFGSI